LNPAARSGGRPSLPGIRVLPGIDGVRVDQRLSEYVAEWFGPDVLLAPAAVFSARAGARIMKAQMMAAAADRLRLWWRYERRIAPRSEFSLGGNDPEPAGVMLLQRAARHRTQNEDQPPVAGYEARDAVHAPYSRAVLRPLPM
jgi:hypothetical protein